MRQRVMIGMALVCHPKLLIADEPTTALDVTIQAQILELLDRLQAELGMAVMLITHDLGVVAGSADRVVVMYAGQVVEQAPTAALFARPLHPYTEGLLASVPRLDAPPARERGRLHGIPGQVPAATAWPDGCRFHPRCPYAWDRCRAEAPPLLDAGARESPAPIPCAAGSSLTRGVARHTRDARARGRAGTRQALPGRAPLARPRPAARRGPRSGRRVVCDRTRPDARTRG